MKLLQASREYATPRVEQKIKINRGCGHDLESQHCKEEKNFDTPGFDPVVLRSFYSQPFETRLVREEPRRAALTEHSLVITSIGHSGMAFHLPILARAS